MKTQQHFNNFFVGGFPVAPSTKVCKVCERVLPLNKYEPRSDSVDGFRHTCNKCKEKKRKPLWYRPLLRRIMNRVRESNRLHRSKAVNSDFMKKLRNRQNGKCYWTGIPIDFTYESKLRSPSIDRLDNKRGYTTDNIVLSIRFANLGRQSSTCAEMRQFLDNFLIPANE